MKEKKGGSRFLLFFKSIFLRYHSLSNTRLLYGKKKTKTKQKQNKILKGNLYLTEI